MAQFSSIFVLTGASISAESGIATFRGGDGLWEGERVEDVATPEAFARNPERVWRFYNQRRKHLAKVQPNAAHQALATLEKQFGGDVLVVTQNVDDLHERAGSQALLHMHGELLQGWCLACNQRFAWLGDMDAHSQCPHCQATGQIRPDIVWFGEMPYHMPRIEAQLQHCSLFVSIGTSGAVYPAAGYVQIARANGAHTLELNLEPSAGSGFFDEAHYGPATKVVCQWVKHILSRRHHD